MIHRSTSAELSQPIWHGWRSVWTLAVVLTLSRLAKADTATREPMRLVWIRGEQTESCPSRVALEERVSQRLGRQAFSDAAPRTIEGFVQREGNRWAAHIYARDADGKLTGSRELTSEAPDCAALEAAITLAIALAIDPEAALLPPPAAGLPAPPPSPPAIAVLPPFSPCPVQRPCPAPIAPPRSEPSVRRTTTMGRAVVAGGLLPAASPGFAVSVDLPVHPVLHVTAGALFLPEVRTSAGDFGFGLTAAQAGACAAPWASSRVSASFCGDVLAGTMHSVVYTLQPTVPGDRFWVGAAAGPELRVRVAGPLVAEAGGEFVVPITRQEFSVTGRTNPAFQQQALSGLGFVGLGVSIP